MSTRLPAFDILLDMARNDPQALEELRQELIESVIAAAPTEARQKRLRGLQFRVDMERQRAKTPLGATIRISELMCQSMAELHRRIVTTTDIESDDAPPAATILPFRSL